MKKQFHMIGLCLLLIAVIIGGVWMLWDSEAEVDESDLLFR